MEFKQAKLKHANRVYELVQENIIAVYPKYYLPEIVDMFCEFHSKENITADIEANNTYVLLENDEIIGTGTKKENHITRVYVLPEFQHKGYGTIIMKQLEELIKMSYDYVYIDYLGLFTNNVDNTLKKLTDYINEYNFKVFMTDYMTMNEKDDKYSDPKYDLATCIYILKEDAIIKVR